MTDMLRIEDSGGALGLTEVQLDPGAEAPVADHEPADHGYYVIDGELSVLLGEQDARLSKGGFAFAPGGVAHRVANEGDAPARLLRMATPTETPGGAPKVVHDLPGRVKVLLLGSDSGGRVALMDNVVPAKTQGPPSTTTLSTRPSTSSRARRPSKSATNSSLAGPASSHGRLAAPTTPSRTAATPTSAGS